MNARSLFHGIDLENEIGFAPDSQNEYKCRPCIHMDAFRQGHATIINAFLIISLILMHFYMLSGTSHLLSWPINLNSV